MSHMSSTVADRWHEGVPNTLTNGLSGFCVPVSPWSSLYIVGKPS